MPLIKRAIWLEESHILELKRLYPTLGYSRAIRIIIGKKLEEIRAQTQRRLHDGGSPEPDGVSRDQGGQP